MSGTNDRKSMSGPARRQERAVKESNDKKKVRLVAVSVVVVLALLFAGAMFLNSKYIRRNMAAVNVDGVEFSAAEYDYFFRNTLYEYQSTVYQNMPDYASSLLPESGKSLRSQIYNDETGETWADYISTLTFTKMGETAQFYSAAKAAGYTLPDEDREAFESELDSMRETASLYGYSSFDAYLQASYGLNMNEATLLKVAEKVNLADSYSRHVRESFTYTPEQLAAHYAEKNDMLDIFTYRYMMVMPETVNAEDYDTTEAYDAAKAAALADATAKAESIAAGINSEQDFIDAAREYNAESYAEDDSTLRLYSGDLLGDNYGIWLRDAARKNGDVTAIEITTGCYIVYFIERSNNDYNMTSMRQILMTPEAVSETDYADDNEAYVDALNTALRDVKTEADLVLAQFEDGGATEEKLLELMAEYSDDTTEGGFYENIFKLNSTGGMVTEIDSWLFDPARQQGDYELIFTELYGYHLVYFMGFGERYCDYLAENSLRNNDYTAWRESLGTPNITTLWAFVLKSPQ